ncbi:PLDc N-terminal domain-containing protein [Pedobacter sp. R-06]|uniref:PLDc N-terminal domain-containing protein n=1 Tax=Pedobacter sp. R-06 TaxID=3404051 RepID=UPI003CECCB46
MNAYLIILAIVVMLIMLVNIYVILDISKFPYSKRRQKWMWTNVVLFLPLFGSLIYFLIGKKILSEN